MSGNRTRVNCLEGSYANHYTNIAWWVYKTYQYILRMDHRYSLLDMNTYKLHLDYPGIRHFSHKDWFDTRTL